MISRFNSTFFLIFCCSIPVVSNGQSSFVNWESPHISPLDITSNGTVLAVNTADNRLEVIDPVAGVIVKSIPVGLDPVSVRVRNDNEAWVVNHISDSISVVDIATGNVIRTLYTDDEPTDVVFAGSPQRAFVSVSQRNKIAVFDPADPSVAPQFIAIAGEDPRSLATDGQKVYAAIFESGNKTMSISEFDVSNSLYNPYPGAPNPAPNFGVGFEPPIAVGLPPAPETSIIVKKNELNQWRDDNNGDWSNWANTMGFDVHDHDVAIIDANTLSVDYAVGLMNANMALTVDPLGGAIVLGTDAINEVRFEPNLQSKFVTVIMAAIDSVGNTISVQDLNPHIDYSQVNVSSSERARSIGDPRGLAWGPQGNQLYVSGMGSDNLIELDSSLNRTGRLVLGEGPTGVRVDNDFVYVLNRFEASVSIVDRDSFTEVDRIPFFDPTPDVIKTGRQFLYNTHLTSGLGQASCGSCHIDSRTDKLAWDLGNPQGEVKMFDQICLPAQGTSCEDWHPMKGPLVTQTLVGLSNSSPFHWRGDRGDFQQFNGTFVDLMGRSTELTTPQMTAFEDFIMTVKNPPNPNRNIDDSFPVSFENGGDAAVGFVMFNTGFLDTPFQCNDCHAGTLGTDRRITPQELDQQAQSMKVPQLRNLYEKTGRDDNSTNNNSGFGFVHDGTFGSLFRFLELDVFVFQDDQEIRDVVAYLMCFSEDFHAAIGTQVTTPSVVPGAEATIGQLLSFAANGEIDLVVKGQIDDEQRGFVWMNGNQFQSDRADQQLTLPELLAVSGPGNELTFTAVPIGTSMRIGIDRDEDGFFDHDELDSCSDPADPKSIPDPNLILGDVSGDGFVNLLDVAPFVDAITSGVFDPAADINCDGMVNLLDVDPFVMLLTSI